MMNSSSLPLLPDSGCGSAPGSVPVFNCIVILRRNPETGRLQGRVANLAGLTVEGSNEREVLIALTRRFRAAVSDALRGQQPITWIEPPETPSPGEQQRFVPVHL